MKRSVLDGGLGALVILTLFSAVVIGGTILALLVLTGLGSLVYQVVRFLLT